MSVGLSSSFSIVSPGESDSLPEVLLRFLSRHHRREFRTVRIHILQLLALLALACIPLNTQETYAAAIIEIAGDTPAATAVRPPFVFGGVGYLHRWSQNDQYDLRRNVRRTSTSLCAIPPLAAWSDRCLDNGGVSRIYGCSALASNCSSCRNCTPSHHSSGNFYRSSCRLADLPQTQSRKSSPLESRREFWRNFSYRFNLPQQPKLR